MRPPIHNLLCMRPLRIFMLALIASLSLGSSASEVRLAGSDGSIPRTYFGMHMHRADTTTAWPTAHFGAWRLWDTHVMWVDLEPSRGDWRFDRLDKLVELAERHGVEPMLTLGVTPKWAASRPAELFVYGYGGNSPPRDMRDWENYVRTVATRYKGRIKYYELWNEPTFDEIDKGRGFYAGSAKTMVELGRVAWRVIKSIDPDNKLISPGFTGEGERLDLYLSLGGKDITDVVAHHFYSAIPENLPVLVKHVRAVMARHGLENRPLWNTEAGFWPPNPGDRLSKEWPRDEQSLASSIARILIMGAASGVDRFYWYSWEQTMLRQKERTQSASAITAYTQTLRWLNGATVKNCESPDRQLWICDLTLRNRQARVVWNTGGARQWTLPADWRAVQYETLDAQVVESGAQATLTLDASPILVKSDRALWSMYQPAARGKRDER